VLGTSGFGYQPALDGVRAWSGLFDGVEHLRRDLWAACAQVYNWVALSSGQTYARFAERLNADYDAATAGFEASGVARVLWVLPPLPAMPFLDAAQYDAYGAALAEVVPERPDGLHWSPDAAARVAADYLGPVVVAAAPA
jgi:hypothetical protein